MADSKVTIKIDADTEDVKKGMAEVEAATEQAMESGANSAKKLEKAIRDVGKAQKKLAEDSELTAQNLKGIATSMASMAMGVAGVGLRISGHEREGAYIGGAASGASQGAGMLAPLGGAGMLAGAIGGGIIGLVQTALEREEVGMQQAEGVGNTVESLAKAREEMDRVAERTDNFEKLLETLGNTTADAASREKLLADEIEKRKQGEDGAREKMKAAEAAMKSFQGTIDGPMTKEQEKYFQTLQENWNNAAKELQTNRAERKTLEGQKIEKDKPEYANDRVQGEFTSLEKLGIGFNAHADSLAQEGNKIANEQLAVLKQIANVAGNGVVFG